MSHNALPAPARGGLAPARAFLMPSLAALVQARTEGAEAA